MNEIQLPSHWKVVTLGDVARIERGKFAHRPRNDPAFYGGDIPFIQTGDVTASNGYVKTYAQTLNQKGLSVSKFFPKGTIVITIAANIGYTAILEFDSAFPDSLIGITPNNKTIAVDAEYLNYYLWTQQLEMDRQAPRGTQKNINIQFLNPWRVVVPPLPEQKTIAYTLRTIQKAKETRQRELELEQERKAALMQYLFTFGTSSSHNKVELQETKIGCIPKFWQINQCDHVCEKISVGVVVKPASHYVEKGVSAFRSLNIREDRLSTRNLVFFSEEANNTILSKSKLKTGDVLIVRTGYPGTSCVVPPEFEGANCIDIVFARPRRELVTSEYLSRYFNSPEGKRQALAAKTGLAQQHLNVNAVQRCLIPIPPLHEQKQITDVLIACDRKIQALEKEIALTDELFHAMLEQLMTGKISTQSLTETYV